MVAEHREAGVFLASFLAGVGPSPGEMIGASLTLAWRRFAGGIDLDGLEIYFREDDPAPGEDPAQRDVRRARHSVRGDRPGGRTGSRCRCR